MFVLDIPDVPPLYAPVMIAQTNQAQSGADKPERAMGICHAIPNGPGSEPTLENTISPVLAAQSYFQEFENRTVEGLGKVTILQGPKHGVLRLVTEADGDRFGEGKLDPASLLHVYLPEPDYIGKDSATLMVEVGGFKVMVVYSFHAADAYRLGYDWVNVFCGKKGYSWKVSLTPDNPSSTIYAFKHPDQLVNPLMGTINANLTFADLPRGVLGQTTGTTITLDENAAGHGWFIDSTPWSNEEYLPTHDPNVWVAKEGSDTKRVTKRVTH